MAASGPLVFEIFWICAKEIAFERLIKIPEFIVRVPSVTVKETRLKATTLYNHSGNTISTAKKVKIRRLLIGRQR